MNAVDQAIADFNKSEATLGADQANLASIDASIATAQAPRPAAASKVDADVSDFNAKADAAISALQASKIAVPPPVPVA